MRELHPGIRIDEIHVEGSGGLIFAIGMTILVLLAVPALVPVVAVAALGGAILAPILHWVYY